ncbi:DUF1883 domain-containing protein [Amycolatopsis magusensis]|uniref:DUF1883 domain-containing protein n=1 Tax=Amycolatopsis magusensis TaxID=882444 RepID=A0ABS4Q0K4_9PSEU|nr:DUF1883 domain-containing protein [Amycolatopsis magusensis]MBP2184685.1 hypothetical protein [Amycolatopsis magusensis]MDI5981670.1 DUF1883 domain-containing protein [Amycolatopsis magusensis]
MHDKVFDLGMVQRETVITVRLNAMANVRLLTEVNYTAYQRKQYYKMHGGVATTPLFKISVPATAHWYLVLDVEGLEPRPLHPQVSIARSRTRS